MSAKVETVSASEPNDGLWLDASGKLYFTAVQKSAIETQAPGAAGRTMLVEDPRLVWPDTFAEGPNATLYVTNSAIQNSPRVQCARLDRADLQPVADRPDGEGRDRRQPGLRQVRSTEARAG